MEGGDLFVLGFGMIEEMEKGEKRDGGMIEVNAGFFLSFAFLSVFFCFVFMFLFLFLFGFD